MFRQESEIVGCGFSLCKYAEKMGWDGVVRQVKTHSCTSWRRASAAKGCPFAEEVVKPCRAEASCLTKPPCSSGERPPVSYSKHLPQRTLGLTQPCWPDVSQEPPVQGERSLCSRCRGPRGHLPILTPASSQSLEGFKAPRKSRSRMPPGRLDSPRTLEGESWFCLRQQFSNLLVSRLLKIGLPTWYGGKESACNAGDCPKCRRLGFDPWVRKILWRRKWQPTPVFLPGKSHGQRSLGGYSPRGRRVRRDWATKQQAFVYVLYQLILPH